MKKAIIITIMFLMIVIFNNNVDASARRVIYNIKQVSNNEFKVTLAWSDGSDENLRVTSYNKVDGDTVEIYYEENSNFDVRGITIDVQLLNMTLYKLNKPNIILKSQDGKVDTLVDLPSDAKISSAIQNLYSRGIISGYEDGTFKPENTITREEFSTMFAKVLGYEIKSEYDSIFSDVPNTKWSKNVIMTLNKNGVISGLGDGTFGAAKNVTLGEAATMVVNAEKLIPIPVSAMYIHLNNSHWANQNITNLITNGCIKTTDSFYSQTCQNKDLTRGEVALILNRLKAK